MSEPQPPGAPSNYTASDIASTTAFVTLPEVDDAGGSELTAWQYRLNTVESVEGAVLSEISRDYIAPFLEGLLPATTYFFQMRVLNKQGGGPYGGWIEFTTRADVPTPPLTVTATGDGDSSVTITWAPPEDLMASELWGYSLVLAFNPSFSEGFLEFTLEEGATALALLDLPPSTTYYVRLHAISSEGPGSRSPVVSFTTTGPVVDPGKPTWMRVAGEWKPGTLWMRVAGEWARVTSWIRVGGTWRKI